MSRFWQLLFIPHEKNNHRAILLKPYFLFIFTALYLFNQFLIKEFTLLKPGVLGYSSEITVQKVYNQTNNQRSLLNLPSLHYNSQLEKSAQNKAQDMFKNNYWAHTSPTGVPPWQFFKDENYIYIVAGENLAKDFYDTESLMKAWMNSPTHKANIINDKYKEIGIGVVNGTLNGVKTTLVVQHFGTPQNEALIENNSPLEKNYLESNQTQVLSDVAVVANKSVSPLTISKIFGLILFGIIIITLFIDAYITLKNQTHRFAGSATGHMGFLLVILFILLFSQQGRIF